MLPRFDIFVFSFSFIYVALASPVGGEFQKRANAGDDAAATTITMATKIATNNQTPTPEVSRSATYIYSDYSGITSKSTDPLYDGWKGMDEQNKGKTFW